MAWNGAQVKSSEISFISCEFYNCYPICNLNFTVECLNCIFLSLCRCIFVSLSVPPALRRSSLIESKVFPLTPTRNPPPPRPPKTVRCKTKRQTVGGKEKNFSRLFRCVSCINKGPLLLLFIFPFLISSSFLLCRGWLIAPTA